MFCFVNGVAYAPQQYNSYCDVHSVDRLDSTSGKASVSGTRSTVAWISIKRSYIVYNLDPEADLLLQRITK